MADTASLTIRVKTEGADQSAKQLDNLGTAAESAQKTVSSMTKEVQSASPKLKGFGTNAQQIGYQVQDMIVQIQGGTSWFTAFGQQGSQLAGILGPGGAVIGAVIALSAAVGGTLYKSIGDAKASAEELAEASKAIDAVFERNASGVLELSDAYVTATSSAKDFALQQAEISSAVSGVNTIYANAKAELKDLTDVTFTFSGSLAGLESSLRNGQETGADRYYDDLADKFGVTDVEARSLAEGLIKVRNSQDPTIIAAFTDQVRKLNDAHGNENTSLAQLLDAVIKYTRAANDKAAADGNAAAKANEHTKAMSAQADAIIKNLQISNLADKERVKAQAAADKEAFAKRQGVTEKQIADYNAARDVEAAQDLARIKESEDRKTAAAAAGAASREAIAQRREESEAKRAQKEAERQAKAEEAEVQRNQKAMEREMEQRQAKQDSADAYIEQLRAQNEGELAEIDRQTEIKLQKLDAFHAEGLVSEKDYQASIQNVQEAAEEKKNAVYMGALDDMTGNLKTALGENNALYKAAAITQTIIETYKGAQAAFSALAPIPIVGPALGGVAAAAAVAAGMARVGQIRSAREQGGTLAAGQASLIGERGKAEVIVPAGASRVRTMDNIRNMVGEGKSSQQPSINIINQTTGRIDSVQQTQDDEGRITLLIREVVSSDLQDSNSRITKSRRATRGQPGFQ